MLLSILIIAIIGFMSILIIIKHRKVKEKKEDIAFISANMDKHLKLQLNKIFNYFDKLVYDLEKEYETGNEPRFGYQYLELVDYININILPLRATLGDYNKNLNILTNLTNGMYKIRIILNRYSVDSGWDPKLLNLIYKIKNKIQVAYEDIGDFNKLIDNNN